MKTRAWTWNRRLDLWLKGIVVALGLAVGGHNVSAQDSHPIPKSYLNKGTINLPIQIDDRVRGQIQEVQLYVKEGAHAPWVLKEKVPGTQTSFTYRAPQDGEYWFNVVTVDRSGRAVPADVTKEQPGLIVVIDSMPPQAEPQLVSSTAEGQQIRCDVHDSNPDPAKTRFYFQTRDQIWRSLEPMNGQPSTFCIPSQAATTGMIRVTACDMAGNANTREFSISSLPMAGSAPLNNPPIARTSPGSVAAENPLEHLTMPRMEAVTPIPTVPAPLLTMEKNTQAIETVVNKIATPALPPIPMPELPPKTPFAVSVGPELRPTVDTTGVALQPDLPASRHIVSNPHVFLDYKIEQTGVSGVGKVEIWYTRDMGQNWQKLGEDAQRKGQAEADLPGEGVYGLTIVVSNGRGFGAHPPQPGDAPDCWIEVDTTKPRAELLNVRTNPNGDDGSLHITWTAKDKNLHTEPIDLYYATNRQGEWKPIAKNLKNDGLYRWVPNSDVGSHAYIRMTARDQAGNSASSETVQPVTLDDLSRPRSRVVGVTTAPRTTLGGSAGPLPPSGN